MGRRGKGSRTLVWGLVCLAGLGSAARARADPGLSALPFWPAAPMVIATSLSAGMVGIPPDVPKFSLGLASRPTELPRVRLLPADQQAFWLGAPPLSSRLAMPGCMPQPPGIEIEHGPRLLI